ncbi:hypothetical protein PRZ57_11240 [Escherichia coli]|nr:hypothetical protein [Escherichia coli]
MKEFIGLLSEHDVLEKYQLSKVTVAANALKLEVVNNNFKNELSSGVTDAEHQLKKRYMNKLNQLQINQSNMN